MSEIPASPPIHRYKPKGSSLPRRAQLYLSEQQYWDSLSLGRLQNSSSWAIYNRTATNITEHLSLPRMEKTLERAQEENT